MIRFLLKPALFKISTLPAQRAPIASVNKFPSLSHIGEFHEGISAHDQIPNLMFFEKIQQFFEF